MSVLPFSVIKLVFGGVMIRANLLKDMGIEHTEKLILNQYHLKKDWKKEFSGSWKRFSHLLIALIEAHDESEYMVAFENLRGQVESQDLRKYIVEEIHPIRENFSYTWIKSHHMHLGRLGYKGAEYNHSSYCVRISFGGFMNPSEKVSESSTRCQYQATKLINKRWMFWTTDLNIAKEWKTKGRDTNNIEALLDFLRDGLFI